MENNSIIVFAVLSALLAVFDLFCAGQCFRRREQTGRYLGLSALLAGVVTLSYFFSIYTTSRLGMSVASSVYFSCIDWMLVALVRFVYLFTKLHLQKSAKIVRISIIAYAVFDSVMMFCNIFTGWVIGYEERRGSIARYIYRMKPLYVAHLIFTYALVVLVLCLLIYKAVKTPRQYRSQYLLIVASITAVVLINAVFLFQDDGSILSQLDWSVFGYSVALLLSFWAAFIYRHSEMLKALSMTIFQCINQGIVLFDHMDELIMYNKKAAEMLPGCGLDVGLNGEEFARRCSVGTEEELPDRFSAQSERRNALGQLLRCDYSRLRDKNGSVVGNLFVFSDITDDTDLLTGFQQSDVFKRFAADNPYAFAYPTTAVIFDPTGLSEVNRSFGRDVGDRRIRRLSQLMRENLPKNAQFIRGYEAHLIAVCEHMTEAELMKSVEKIVDLSVGNVSFGICEMGEDRVVTAAIDAASRSMQIKKLLSHKSFQSQKLASLVRALQETDPDTEAHVRRTQKMGAALGRRIGLSDAQQADLQLLCLLHDIGKIGIPLEILNKPGKLSEQELRILHSHAEKGYHIAMSSDELKEIAPMILSHHERWDGTGYPERLSGEKIPILSRVICLVDSYDAMVNNRSYHKGMPPENAQTEIRRCAGTQFDPALTEEFLKMLQEDPAIAQGELTGGEEIRVFSPVEAEEEESGSTSMIPFSRYVLDIDDVILEADEHFEDLTGYSPREVVGRMQQHDLLPPEERNHYLRQVNMAFLKGGIAYLRHPILRKDGSTVWVVCCGKRYFDSAVKSFRSEILIFRTSDGGAEDRKA